MPYTQVKNPNLDPVLYQDNQIILDWVGWCLLYVQTAFGASWAGSTAKDAWEKRVKFKHTDRNIPSGVYVPIWFSGYYNQGHVAIYKDGKIWSTPIKRSSTFTTFNSIDELERTLSAYDVKYLGWSEDVSGTRVIEQQAVQPQEEKKVMVDEAGLRVLYRFYLGRDISDWGYRNRLGKQTFAQAQSELIATDAYKKYVADFAETQTGAVNNLPEAMRKAIKLPEQIK